MKHLLLLLISILLLSSPVIGDNHKGETLYRWGVTPPFVWKGFGDKETHPKYEGDVENGKPNGLGILIDPVGEKYIGSWKDGKRNGEGTSTFFGMKYVGKWKNGYRHGQGTYTIPLVNEVFEGEWKGGRLWNGTNYTNGNINSKFVNGLVEKLVGEKKVEVVVQKKEKGVLYGRYVNGKTKWYKSGDENDKKYVGEIENGKPNGQGTYTNREGKKYVGEWKNGLPNGQGTETFSSGSKYVGEYKDGLKNGQGTYTWSSGDKYVGDYKDGKQHGQGTGTWSDGRKYVGEWKDRKRWNGTQYDKDGNILGKIVNGKDPYR